MDRSYCNRRAQSTVADMDDLVPGIRQAAGQGRSVVVTVQTAALALARFFPQDWGIVPASRWRQERRPLETSGALQPIEGPRQLLTRAIADRG